MSMKTAHCGRRSAARVFAWMATAKRLWLPMPARWMQAFGIQAGWTRVQKIPVPKTQGPRRSIQGGVMTVECPGVMGEMVACPTAVRSFPMQGPIVATAYSTEPKPAMKGP
jgi:hypothetical protein